jgi:hypothetical protein
LYKIGAIFSGIITIILLMFIPYTAFSLILVAILVINLVIWAAVLNEYERLTNTVMKRFLMDVPTAAKIIQMVLGEKNLPFDVSQRVEFWVDTEGEPIRIKINQQKYFVSVVISSKSAENLPLIESLCAKLDEAFTPRGLN